MLPVNTVLELCKNIWKKSWKTKFLYMKHMVKSIYHLELGSNTVKHSEVQGQYQETWTK